MKRNRKRLLSRSRPPCSTRCVNVNSGQIILNREPYNTIQKSDLRERSIAILSCLALLSLFPFEICADEKSDAIARAAIFAEQHVAESTNYLQKSIAQLSPEERYRKLSDWVLPSESHPDFRLHLDFAASPLDVWPVHGIVVDQVRLGFDAQANSPALLLVDSASQLKRLNELRNRVKEVSNDSVESQISQTAILVLVDVALDEIETAHQSLETLFDLLLRSEKPTEHAERAAILVASRALQAPQLQEIIADSFNRFVLKYSVERDRSTLKRHISAIASSLNFQNANGKPTNLPSTQWSAASISRASSRGDGFPIARWHISPGLAKNSASHTDDYLYFNTPMRGNFEVECDVSRNDWTESQIMFSGVWVDSAYDRRSYYFGDLLRYRREKLDTMLTKCDSWAHYRLVVRDQRITTYFNGRLLHEHPISPEHDPWLAIHSSSRSDGGVRNLRVSGEPLIPERIVLSDAQSFSSWIPYHDVSSRSEPNNWRLFRNESTATVIRGEHRAELTRGCNDERLLYYHRPMFEDGTIEYEFYYENGKSVAHPAIGQTAMIIAPNGVQLHEVSDGVHDRSDCDPSNRTDMPRTGLQAIPLPLRERAWNTMQLQLKDENLTLSLNGKKISEQTLESTNSRKFGLFYFSDQTDLQVRNVVWSGSWPRALPAIAQQELAGETSDSLDEKLADLTSVFEHDFVRQGFPKDRFSILDGSTPANIQLQSNGLHFQRPGTGGYKTVRVAVKLSIHGDYDIVASFDQLSADPVPDGTSTVALETATNQASSEEIAILRRVQNPNRDDTNYLQCLKVQDANNKGTRSYFSKEVTEATSGTLRIARRGNQAYFLLAENDSGYFRLIAKESCSSSDLLGDALRLMAQIHGNGGTTSVIWKKLAVRAEKLSGGAIDGVNSTLLALNQQREALPVRLNLDLAKESPDSRIYFRWLDTRPWNAKDGGLSILCQGRETWHSAGASVLKEVSGDFDANIQFEPLKIDIPATGKHGEVLLQAELQNPKHGQANMHFRALHQYLWVNML